MTCDSYIKGWEAVESKTEAMDAFVNVANDMSEVVRLVQQWRVTDEGVQGMVEAMQMQVRMRDV